jgi:hypothetical protein
MVWDVLNAVVQVAIAALHAMYALLPASPLFVPSSLPSDLAGPLGYAAWAFPVVPALTILALYVVAVTVYVVVLLVRQLIEAAIP